MLDLILDNEAELPIVEHTTDTYGVTDIVFALFALLGLQFSPRIKGVCAYPVWGKRLLRTGAPPTTSDAVGRRDAGSSALVLIIVQQVAHPLYRLLTGQWDW